MAREYDPAINGPRWENAVERSHEYFMDIISKNQYKIIDSYRANTDPDDWPDAPLEVSYQIINWATKKINKNNNAKQGHPVTSANYVPRLLTPEGLEESGIDQPQLIAQVEKAQILDETLHSFPLLEKNEKITVYRGENCTSFYYQKAANMNIGGEMVILPFLSTSINRYVAERFTSKLNINKSCLWEITLMPGQIFPYVSEDVPDELGNENSAQGSEQEVLLPTHARLRLLSKSVEERPHIYRFELVGFDEITPDFWDRTLNNLLSVLPRRKRARRGGKYSGKQITKKRNKNNKASYKRKSLHIHMRRRSII